MSRNPSEIDPKSGENIVLGPCVFDPVKEEVRTQSGELVPLRDQSIQVLSMLAKHRNETVAKDALVEAVWGNTFVTDDSLVQCISDIRKAIGDTDHKIIQTFAKKGYRLNAPIAAGTAGRASRRLARAVLIAASALVFAIVGLWTLLFQPGDEGTDAPLIAVMAFDDHSNGADKGFLSDAIAEGVITELSRFREFSVIARESSFQYRDKATDVRTIAAELGVHYILEGSQQKDGEHLRVTVQLIDALSGKHVWAEVYDRELADIFAVQSEIVRTVTSSVGFEVAYNPPPSGGLKSVSALRYHLQGRPFVRQVKKEAIEKAGELNLKAIEADPTSPYGYIGMAFVYWQKHRFGWSELGPEETLARAEAYAEKALEIDPDNYSAHYARARVHVEAGEMDLAIARYKRSIELNPSSPNVMMGLATPLVYKGDVKEAVELIQRAMKIHPHHPDWFLWMYAWTLWHNGDCEEAMSSMERVAKIPSSVYRRLAAIQVCLGRQAEAEATIAKLLEKRPGHTVTKEREAEQGKYANPADLERWLDALRKAGLPEN